MQNKTKNPGVAALGFFLLFTVSYSVQAVAAYSSRSSHLHMQQPTTLAATEIINAGIISFMQNHLPSAGGTAAQLSYHSVSLLSTTFSTNKKIPLPTIRQRVYNSITLFSCTPMQSIRHHSLICPRYILQRFLFLQWCIFPSGRTHFSHNSFPDLCGYTNRKC